MLSNMIVRVERRSIHWRQRDALSSVIGSHEYQTILIEQTQESARLLQLC